MKLTSVASAGVVLALATVTVALAWRSRSWPLVHDIPILHYLAWRIGEGAAPYRDLFDMNFPGTYLLHLAVLRVLGPGDAEGAENEERAQHEVTLARLPGAACEVVCGEQKRASRRRRRAPSRRESCYRKCARGQPREIEDPPRRVTRTQHTQHLSLIHI